MLRSTGALALGVALAVSPVLADEPAGEAPPYPFAAGAPPPGIQGVLARRVSVKLEQTPLDVALRYVAGAAGAKLEIDPNARRLLASAGDVSLTLRGIAALHAISVIRGMAGGKLAWGVLGETIRIYSTAEEDGPPRPFPPQPRPLEKSDLEKVRDLFLGDQPWEHASPEIHWRPGVERILNEKKVSLALVEEPLGDALATLSEAAGLSFRLSSEVDAAAVKVTFATRDATAGAALQGLLAAAKGQALRFALRDGVVVVATPERIAKAGDDAPEPRGPCIREKKVTLDLRGATVVDLARALEAQGLSVIASEEGWRSRGTISFAAKDVPLPKALADLEQDVPSLRAWIAPSPLAPDREVVAISGALPGVRAALEGEVPDRFAGAAAQVERHRKGLRETLARRDEKRKEPRVDAELRDLERTVHDQTAALAKLLGTISGAAGALARRAELERDLARARQVLGNAAEAHTKLLAADRVRELELELAASRKLVGLGERLAEGGTLPE